MFYSRSLLAALCLAYAIGGAANESNLPAVLEFDVVPPFAYPDRVAGDLAPMSSLLSLNIASPDTHQFAASTEPTVYTVKEVQADASDAPAALPSAGSAQALAAPPVTGLAHIYQQALDSHPSTRSRSRLLVAHSTELSGQLVKHGRRTSQ